MFWTGSESFHGFQEAGKSIMSREHGGRGEKPSRVDRNSLSAAVTRIQQQGHEGQSNPSDQIDLFSSFIYNSPEAVFNRETTSMEDQTSAQQHDSLLNIFPDMDPQASYRDEDPDFFNFMEDSTELGNMGSTDAQSMEQSSSMVLHNTPSIPIPGFPPLVPDMHPGIVIPANNAADNSLQQRGITPIQQAHQLPQNIPSQMISSATATQMPLQSPSYNPFSFPLPQASTQAPLQLDPFSHWTFDPTSLDSLDSPFSDSTPTTEYPIQQSQPTSPTLPLHRQNSLASIGDTPSTSNSLLRPTKTSHNMIEKRYRLKLNDKILSLRNAVPALRGQTQDAVIPGKLNKGTVLTKATEYIQQLEREKNDLEREVERLRQELEARKGFEWGGVANVVVNENCMISPESCTSVMSPPEGEGMWFGEAYDLRPRKRVRV